MHGICIYGSICCVLGLPNLLGSTIANHTLSSPYGRMHVSICVNDVFDQVHKDFRKVRLQDIHYIHINILFNPI